jgi:hypothetical protein
MSNSKNSKLLKFNNNNAINISTSYDIYTLLLLKGKCIRLNETDLKLLADINNIIRGNISLQYLVKHCIDYTHYRYTLTSDYELFPIDTLEEVVYNE